jgi:hypothetical protein
MHFYMHSYLHKNFILAKSGCYRMDAVWTGGARVGLLYVEEGKRRRSEESRLGDGGGSSLLQLPEEERRKGNLMGSIHFGGGEGGVAHLQVVRHNGRWRRDFAAWQWWLEIGGD